MYVLYYRYQQLSWQKQKHGREQCTYGNFETQFVDAEGGDEAEGNGHKEVGEAEPIDIFDIHFEVLGRLVGHGRDVDPQLRREKVERRLWKSGRKY